ncbi:hypothetical protein C9E81_04260 [Paracoccus alkanivorans]|uniref:Uncharacterized protein n=1 Tax=Paracoccus alkanivorans TaxID=2116655 RepID=A0A3M0MLL0_9RHOB|nr:hypothetical protein C9E81_04260 [Paracoccus alkanivorans]
MQALRKMDQSLSLAMRFVKAGQSVLFKAISPQRKIVRGQNGNVPHLYKSPDFVFRAILRHP